MKGKNKKVFIVATVIIVVVVAVVVYLIVNSQQKIMPGSDRDEHGCIGSAGYSWCAAKDKCLRIWEEPCQ